MVSWCAIEAGTKGGQMMAVVSTLKLAGKGAINSAFAADAGATSAPAFQLTVGPRWVPAVTTTVC
jgi:hypothetical protein